MQGATPHLAGQSFHDGEYAMSVRLDARSHGSGAPKMEPKHNKGSGSCISFSHLSDELYFRF